VDTSWIVEKFYQVGDMGTTTRFCGQKDIPCSVIGVQPNPKTSTTLALFMLAALGFVCAYSVPKN
jgi:hypothetical protein